MNNDKTIKMHEDRHTAICQILDSIKDLAVYQGLQTDSDTACIKTIHELAESIEHNANAMKILCEIPTNGNSDDTTPTLGNGVKTVNMSMAESKKTHIKRVISSVEKRLENMPESYWMQLKDAQDGKALIGIYYNKMLESEGNYQPYIESLLNLAMIALGQYKVMTCKDTPI